MRGPKNNKKTSTAARFSGSGIDFQQLEVLLDFMATHGLEEFEYEHGGLHIRLKKAFTGAAAMQGSQGNASEHAAGMAAGSGAASGARPVELPPAPAAVPAAEELHIIKSPIVGTFYAAPSADAQAFVKAHDIIHAGQVVCIVEAMKLMNEIEADVNGEVARVLVENGQPVEYGQPLFAIRPTRKK